MQREAHVLLWDICHAADAVAAFTRGKGLADYKQDSLDDLPVLRASAARLIEELTSGT
jgi:uncharacterized protein with HEPN domain